MKRAFVRLVERTYIAKLVLAGSRFHWTHLPWLPGKWRLSQLALKCLDSRLLEPVATFEGSLHMKIDPQDYIQRFVFATGVWEQQTTDLLRCLLKPGDVFVDVGSHVGYFAMLAARLVEPEGTVHAFEPVPSLFSQLGENVTANGLDNILLNDSACWSSDGPITIYESNHANSGKSSAYNDNADSRAGKSIESHEVEGVTLDTYLERVGTSSVNLIKIDVEGGEKAVLAGARETLARHRPVIIMEVVPDLVSKDDTPPLQFIKDLVEDTYDCRILDWSGPPEAPGAIDEGWGNVILIPRGDLSDSPHLRNSLQTLCRAF